MSAVQTFDLKRDVSEAWIDEFMRRMGWHNRDRVVLALLATLHALRDCLPQDVALQVGAQLPLLLRGLYYQSWHPGDAGPTIKSQTAFLERIHDGVHRDPGIDSVEVARGVFALLMAHLSAANVEDVKASTPKRLRNLWPS